MLRTEQRGDSQKNNKVLGGLRRLCLGFLRHSHKIPGENKYECNGVLLFSMMQVLPAGNNGIKYGFENKS